MPTYDEVSYSAGIAGIISQVSQSAIDTDLDRLTGGTTITLTGENPGDYTLTSRDPANTTQITRATQWVYEQMEAAGWSVSYQNWSHTVNCRNVIGTKTGSVYPSERIVLYAHLDSYWPGADDNASGCAALLSIARILGGETLERTVDLVFTTGEENYDRYGALTYIASISAPYASICLDTIGYNASSGDEMAVLTGDGDRHTGTATEIALGGVLADVNTEYSLGLQTNYVGDYLDPGAWVDANEFWEAGAITVAVVSETSPYEHASNDTVASLDLPFLTSVVKAALGSTAHLANYSSAIGVGVATISGLVPRLGHGIVVPTTVYQG